MGRMKETLWPGWKPEQEVEKQIAAEDANEVPREEEEWKASPFYGFVPPIGPNPTLPPPVSYDEREVYEMQLEGIRTELDRVRDVIEGYLERDKYYSEPPTREQLEFIDSELRRISRDLT